MSILDFQVEPRLRTQELSTPTAKAVVVTSPFTATVQTYFRPCTYAHTYSCSNAEKRCFVSGRRRGLAGHVSCHGGRPAKRARSTADADAHAAHVTDERFTAGTVAGVATARHGRHASRVGMKGGRACGSVGRRAEGRADGYCDPSSRRVATGLQSAIPSTVRSVCAPDSVTSTTARTVSLVPREATLQRSEPAREALVVRRAEPKAFAARDDLHAVLLVIRQRVNLDGVDDGRERDQKNGLVLLCGESVSGLLRSDEDMRRRMASPREKRYLVRLVEREVL